MATSSVYGASVGRDEVETDMGKCSRLGSLKDKLLLV